MLYAVEALKHLAEWAELAAYAVPLIGTALIVGIGLWMRWREVKHNRR